MIHLLLLSLLLPAQSTQAQLELAAGGGLYKSDPALTTQMAFDARSDQIAFGLSVPLIATISDGGLSFAKRMWDSPTDYAHAIRYLTWRGRARFMKLGLRIGESHRLTLGTGAIVANVNYLLFEDNPHTGAQFGLSHDNLEVFAFTGDFVEPQSGGLSVTAHLPMDIFIGGTLFADPSMPLSMRDNTGATSVDQELWHLIPVTTDRFMPLSLFAGYKLASWLSVSGELITLEATDTSALGGLLHMKATFEREHFSVDLRLSGGGGGNHFQPFVAGPFYLRHREFSGDEASLPLLAALRQSDNPGYGLSAHGKLKLHLSKESSLSLTADFARNRFGDVGSGEVSLVLSRLLVVALYGAMDSHDNAIFSAQGRLALPRGWFIWARAKRLFTIGAGRDYYQSSTQILAGVGYRELP